jgi:hypothetical protein
MTQEALLSVVSNLLPIRTGVLKFKKGVKKVFKTEWSRHIDEHDETNDDGYVATHNDGHEDSVVEENAAEISKHVDLIV